MNAPHPDPELLALAALPAEPTDLGVAGHLQSCRQCRAHVDGLRRTVELARGDGGEVLPAPPPRVWQSIVDVLAADDLAPDDDADKPATTAATATLAAGSTEAAAGAGGDAESATVEEPQPARDTGPTGGAAIRSVEGKRRRGTSPRRIRTGLAAAAAAVALLAGLGIGLGIGSDQAPAPQAAPVVRLGPVGFADPTATGTAAMVDSDGDQKMVVELRGVTDLAGGDYLEAWLMDATGSRLVPLGALARHGEEFRGEFLVPAGLPVSEYDRVDVSAERFDGDPGHSTVSLLRGDLA
jgi:Anti-sigma-K factor rskA